LLPGQEAQPLAEFDAKGHTIRLYAGSAGDVVIAERKSPQERSVLEGLPDDISLTSLYSRFQSGPVPAAIVEFDARAIPPDGSEAEIAATAPAAEASGSPKVASEAAPGLRLTHEDGTGDHFRAAHCATTPSSSIPDLWTMNPPTAVRTFCWASGFTGSWTETASARVLTQAVSAISGDICYTLSTSDGTSMQFNIFQGEQWDFNWRNAVYDDTSSCPPWPFACGAVPRRIRIKTMNGAVGCASGDSWRFGGGFWK
jgi:hypothetical protein